MMVDKSGFRTHASPVIVENLKNCARKRILGSQKLCTISKTFLYVRGIGAIGRHRDIFTSKALLSYLARSNCCDHKRMYRLLRSRWIQKAPLKIDRAIVNNELPDVLAIRYYRMRAL